MTDEGTKPSLAHKQVRAAVRIWFGPGAVVRLNANGAEVVVGGRVIASASNSDSLWTDLLSACVPVYAALQAEKRLKSKR
jgi:hypothetical protein